MHHIRVIMRLSENLTVASTACFEALSASYTGLLSLPHIGPAPSIQRVVHHHPLMQ
jgi:hypothetical protein